jgi:hypothetical protein
VKTREQGLFFGQCHVFVFAPAIRLGLERFYPTVVVGHVRPGLKQHQATTAEMSRDEPPRQEQ